MLSYLDMHLVIATDVEGSAIFSVGEAGWGHPPLWFEPLECLLLVGIIRL